MGDPKQSNGTNGATKRHIKDEEPSCSGDSTNCSGDVTDVTQVPSHVTHVMYNLENIIRNVFSCLPIRSLQNVTRVCRKWQELADIEKKSRHQVHWTLAEIHRTHHVLQYLSNPINNAYSIPKVVFLFVAEQLFMRKLEVPRSDKDEGSFQSGVRLIPKRRRRVTSVEAYMRNLLPPNCQICGVVVDGVIGTYHNTMHIKELEKGDAISCLMIPTLHNMAVTRFYLGDGELSALHKARGNLQVVTEIPEEHEAVLTLLFYQDADLTMMPVAPARLIRENKTSRVVAGAVVHTMLRHNIDNSPLLLRSGFPDTMSRGGGRPESPRQNDVTGVIFSARKGSTDLKVASVYFPEEMNTEAEVKDKMAALKKCHIPERNTLGFLIACCGRGEEFYGRDNVESAAFHQLFPGVPLVGMFGQGEICHDYLPDYARPESVAEWDARSYDEIHRCVCSCVVLLHLGEQGGRLVV